MDLYVNNQPEYELPLSEPCGGLATVWALLSKSFLAERGGPCRQDW